MLLTALFALNIGSIQPSTTVSELSVEYYIGLFLLLSVGLCIDVSKYLFWLYRERHWLFLLLSIVLVCFSWAASVAFFVSKENHNIRQHQLDSSQYTANKIAISLLESEISEKKKLLEKRLSSNYHSQWDKGEEILEDINGLKNELSRRVEMSDKLGVESAQLKLSTSVFFSAISSMLSISFSSVSNIAYGVLSLIIEVCALGIMSLRQIVEYSPVVPIASIDNTMAKDTSYQTKVGEQSDKKADKVNKIRDDLLAGRTRPLISKIIKDYSISHTEAKAIMKDLESEGKILIKRNRYYLVK